MKRTKIHHQIGLSWPMVFMLGALGLPLAIGHDLELTGGSFYIGAFLALAPAVFWIWYVISKNIPKTFYTLVAIGLAYGVLLGLTHQFTWNIVWADAPGGFGGISARFSNFFSSIMTGIFTGAVLGAIAVFLKYSRGDLKR